MPSGSEISFGASSAVKETGLISSVQARSGNAGGLTQWAILVTYAAAVGIAIAYHEPWADEAQAWLIAKSLPFWRMLMGQARYEGTPGLWHSLLWLLSHAGLPYTSLLWLSWTAAVCSTWFLLTFSPFPLFLRALIPFTFYLSYQFAVVGRSYVLMPLLLFAAVHLIRNRSKRSIVFGVIIGLLANCNVFGLFVSSGLAIVYLWAIFRRYPRAIPVLLRGSVPYLLLTAVAVVTAIPPRDLRFVPSPLGDALNRHRGVATPAPIGSSGFDAPLRQRVQDYTSPLSHSIWVGVLFVGVVIWQLRTRRLMITLVPVGCLMLSFELVYKAPRHTGLFLLMLIAAMWLGWPDRDVPLRRYHAADLACLGTFLLICLPQIAWGARAIHYEVSESYSGSKACAEYLKTNAAGRKVFGYDYFTVAVTAYFDGPIFRNQATPYWSWSVSNRNDLRMDRIVFEKPDFVVLGWHQNAQFGYLISSTLSPSVDQMQQYMEATGYEKVATFTGAQVMRNSFSEKDFFAVYRRPELTPGEWQALQYRLYDPPGIQH